MSPVFQLQQWFDEIAGRAGEPDVKNELRCFVVGLIEVLGNLGMEARSQGDEKTAWEASDVAGDAWTIIARLSVYPN